MDDLNNLDESELNTSPTFPTQSKAEAEAEEKAEEIENEIINIKEEKIQEEKDKSSKNEEDDEPSEEEDEEPSEEEDEEPSSEEDEESSEEDGGEEEDEESSEEDGGEEEDEESSEEEEDKSSEEEKDIKNLLNPVSEDTDEESEESDDEDYLQKFDSELKKDYIINFHPEAVINNYDELITLSQVVRDKNGVIIDPLHRTNPFMTRFEKTKIIGERANQINKGGKSFIKLNDDIIDGVIIAEMELERKKIPFIIRRPMPNGGSEFWNVKDLELLI